MDQVLSEIRNKFMHDLGLVHADWTYAGRVVEHVEAMIDCKLALMLEELSRRMELKK